MSVRRVVVKTCELRRVTTSVWRGVRQGVLGFVEGNDVNGKFGEGYCKKGNRGGCVGEREIGKMRKKVKNGEK